MTVSVIVPNFCHAPYLKERIDSILGQTHQDFELILLDDCSTDNSREVLESYRNHRKVSHIVFNEQNSGSPFKQWQRGFELAQGRYIWIAESDDFAEPQLLERCVSALEADPHSVLAHTDGYFTDSEGNITTKTRKTRPTETIDGSRFALERLLMKNTIYNASMAVFRRDALPDATEYANYRYNGDLLFWILISIRGHVSSIHEQLNYFRQHKTNTTGHSVRSGMMYAEMLPLLECVLPQLKISTSDRWKLLGRFTSHLRRDGRKNHWQGIYNDVWKLWRIRYPSWGLYIMCYKLIR